MVSKQAFNVGDGSVLKELKDILSISDNTQTQDPSSIYYMEILDENPYSSDTMMQLAEFLLNHVSSDY